MALRALTLLLVLAAFAAACGGDEEDSAAATEETPTATATATATEEAAGGGADVEVTAVEGADGLGWDPEALTAPAGDVTIVMDNPEGNELPHTVAIEGGGVEASGTPVPGGQTSTVEASLESGEYTFYCPVGQHRQNGMEGTLTVE